MGVLPTVNNDSSVSGGRGAFVVPVLARSLRPRATIRPSKLAEEAALKACQANWVAFRWAVSATWPLPWAAVSSG